jgi:hypothetical protein
VFAASKTDSVVEPYTFEEALSSPNANDWQQAADSEVSSLLANNTYELGIPPPGVKPIPTRWVFKVKRDGAGNITRYKARLVVKGYMQKEGIDYTEVYAPVSKHSSLRALLGIAAAEDLEMHALDFTTAFLNGKIDTEVWVLQPPGYEQGPPGTACRLLRTLYGLHQAPRAWNQELTAALSAIGYVQSNADPGLFISADTKEPSYLLTYVDDTLIIAKDLNTVTYIKEQLMSAFDARDLGEAKLFLGMTITRDRSARTLDLGQRLIIANLLDKYALIDCKPRTTPLSPSVRLSKTEGEPLDTTKFNYSALVGSLLYLSVCTRPDISHTVGVLSKYMSCPTTEHWQVAMGVLRYLSGSINYGLHFCGGITTITGYCDADYAGDLDTRRSTTGYVFLMGNTAISWSSRRQHTVAASTAEAEYMSASAATKEALWLRTLLADLQRPLGTVTIHADNQSCIKLLSNPISSLRSKHIDVIYHFARERVARKEVEFCYINTNKMVADIMTKPLPEAKHKFCSSAMGVN